MNNYILKGKKNKFKKILSFNKYSKSRIECKLVKFNQEILKIKEFEIKSFYKLFFIAKEDVLSFISYMDFINYKKKENLKNLKILEIEYKKYYNIYLDKCKEEKKIKTLIKKINNTIINKIEKKENLLLDEYMNYKVCKELGVNNE